MLVKLYLLDPASGILHACCSFTALFLHLLLQGLRGQRTTRESPVSSQRHSQMKSCRKVESRTWVAIILCKSWVFSPIETQTAHAVGHNFFAMGPSLTCSHMPLSFRSIQPVTHNKRCIVSPPGARTCARVPCTTTHAQHQHSKAFAHT